MSAAAPDAPWPHLFRPGAADAPVLVLLHGTGGNEHEVSRLADVLDPNAAVLAPRGRVQENGLNRWFRRLSEGVFDTDDVARRADDLAGFLVWARKHYALGDRHLVAVGFSNGANIALATALLHPEVLARVIAFSGMHPLDRVPTAPDSGTEPPTAVAAGSEHAIDVRLAQTELAASTVLLLNGRQDPMAPLASVQKLVTALVERGATVQQELRPGGHGIAETDIAAAAAWLRNFS
ncbi:MAG: alpha/beta hydrolase [Cryobacterium sp.]|uniref:alpha/beta hydrolase n=1 Tax=unclassified Cryobacterium TaxID=2649013 RepID=UPI0018CB0FC9|nr:MULTISPECIES: alpha/beta hydrolase [unclassified Cryobacterium]MCY7403538.1 alpha/beta hydrolase [Cryobacterium sp.]MEC5153269.1 phospholipase/carboxylesterase [Cryobacterium sp. CAN_C3]